jgi:hypothetical protein
LADQASKCNHSSNKRNERRQKRVKNIRIKKTASIKKEKRTMSKTVDKDEHQNENIYQKKKNKRS